MASLFGKRLRFLGCASGGIITTSIAWTYGEAFCNRAGLQDQYQRFRNASSNIIHIKRDELSRGLRQLQAYLQADAAFGQQMLPLTPGAEDDNHIVDRRDTIYLARTSGPSGTSSASLQPLPFISPIGKEDKIGTGLLSLPNDINAPHLASHGTEELEGELVPHPVMNYLWKPTTNDPVAELEAHIASISEVRQRNDAEAEFLWQWIAEKEAEFYSRGNLDDPQEYLGRRRALEVLGGLHTEAWLAARSCDWIIMSSRKRIDQLRSAAASTDGRTVDWRPQRPTSAALPRFTMYLLRVSTESAQAHKEALEAALTELTMQLADPDLEVPEGQMPSPLTGKMVTSMQSLSDTKKFLEMAVDNARFDLDVTAKVYKETKERQNKQ